MFKIELWGSIFFTVLRSVAIPIAAVYLLSKTALGEEGALIAVGLALLVTNALAILWNIIKLLTNAILLKPGHVFRILIVIGIQIISVALIWVYYLSNYTDYLSS